MPGYKIYGLPKEENGTGASLYDREVFISLIRPLFEYRTDEMKLWRLEIEPTFTIVYFQLIDIDKEFVALSPPSSYSRRRYQRAKNGPRMIPPSLYAALARNTTTSKREIRQFYKSSYYDPLPNRRTLVISPHLCGSVIVFPLRNIGKTDVWEKGRGGGGKEEGH